MMKKMTMKGVRGRIRMVLKDVQDAGDLVLAGEGCLWQPVGGVVGGPLLAPHQTGQQAWQGGQGG